MWFKDKNEHENRYFPWLVLKPDRKTIFLRLQAAFPQPHIPLTRHIYCSQFKRSAYDVSSENTQTMKQRSCAKMFVSGFLAVHAMFINTFKTYCLLCTILRNLSKKQRNVHRCAYCQENYLVALWCWYKKNTTYQLNSTCISDTYTINQWIEELFLWFLNVFNNSS